MCLESIYYDESKPVDNAPGVKIYAPHERLEKLKREAHLKGLTAIFDRVADKIYTVYPSIDCSVCKFMQCPFNQEVYILNPSY